MFSRCKNFVCRHKKKFVIGSIVVGGVVFGLNFAQKKFIEWQERETRKFLKKTQKEQHYQCTLRTCNQTICSLSVPLKESIFKFLNSEDILLKIREGEGVNATLWNELKVVVFSQVFTFIYSGLMLVLFLRIQLNILGGYMIHEDGSLYTSNFQESYISLCHHFLENGIQDLCNLIKKHAEFVLKDVSLKQKLSLEDIEQLFWRFDLSLSRDPLNPLKNLPFYLIQETNGTLLTKPEGSLDNKEKNMLKTVISETIDLLKSIEIQSMCEKIIKRAYSVTVDRIAGFYVPPASDFTSKDTGDFSVSIHSIKLPLAKLVPILHGLFEHVPANGGLEPWIEQFINNERLIALGQNIYEGFSRENSLLPV